MKRAFWILGGQALVCVLFLAPDFYPAGTLGKVDLWVTPDIGDRAKLLFFVLVPTLFLIFFSDEEDFSIAPPYFPFIEIRNLLGTAAYIVLCFSTVGAQGRPETPLACAISLFGGLMVVVLALRVAILEGPFVGLIHRDFKEKCTNIIKILTVALLILAIALSFILPLFGALVPSAYEFYNIFGNVSINGTTIQVPIITIVSFALVLLVFIINQITGLFHGFADFVTGRDRITFSKSSSRKNIDCRNCQHFYMNDDCKPCCYVCGRLMGKLNGYGGNCDSYKDRR